MQIEKEQTSDEKSGPRTKAVGNGSTGEPAGSYYLPTHWQVKTGSLFGHDAAKAGQPHEPGRPCYLKSFDGVRLVGRSRRRQQSCPSGCRRIDTRANSGHMSSGHCPDAYASLLARHLAVNRVIMAIRIAATTLRYLFIPRRAG